VAFAAAIYIRQVIATLARVAHDRLAVALPFVSGFSADLI
jgi:hypothetical protein